MEAYETIGGLFKDLKLDYVENKLNINRCLPNNRCFGETNRIN